MTRTYHFSVGGAELYSYYCYVVDRSWLLGCAVVGASVGAIVVVGLILWWWHGMWTHMIGTVPVLLVIYVAVTGGRPLRHVNRWLAKAFTERAQDEDLVGLYSGPIRLECNGRNITVVTEKASITLDQDSVVLDQCGDLIAIEALPNCRVLIPAAGFSQPSEYSELVEALRSGDGNVEGE